MTVTKLLLLFASGLIALSLLVLFFHSNALHTQCTPLVSSEQAKALIEELDNNSHTLSSSTKEIYNESSEGGVQTNYTDTSGTTHIIEQRLFGAIGRTFMRFYFDGGQMFALVKLDEQYAVPINVDSNAVVNKSTEEDYYFSSDRHVCSLIVNGQPQPLATTTQEMIANFISQIRM